MRSRLAPAGLVAVAGLVASAGAARAQQTFYEWTGFGGTAWSSSGSWDPVGVPNGAGDVALFLGGKTCDLDISVTVDKLGNGFGDTLNMLNDRDLTVIGDPDPGDDDAPTGLFSVYGVVNMLATSHATDLRVSTGTLTIGNIDGAPCALHLSDSPNNRIFGVNGAVAIQFGDSLLVRGSGQIGLDTCRINNWGTVRADQPTRLWLDPGAGGWFNYGEISAESGATVQLDTGVYTNSGGLIAARDGSVVLLNGATITGAGAVQTFGSGVVRVATTGAATWLDGQTVGGTVELPNDTDLRVTGAGSFAALNMLAASHATDLYIDGPVTLNATTLNLSDSPNNRLLWLNGGLSGDHLTIATGLVRGSGQLGLDSLDIVNTAAVVADQPTALVIDPAATFQNVGPGQLLAQSGGTLRLEPGVYDNQGLVGVTEGSVVQLNGCTINGMLGGSGTGYYDVLTTRGATALEGVTLGRRLNLSNDRDAVLRGTITNGASVDMGAAGHSTDLYIDGPVTLTGGGSLNLSDSPNNRVLWLSGGLDGDGLVNLDNTIRGSGQLGLDSIDIVNAGVIRADWPGGVLSLDPAATVINTGLVEGAGGGVLRLEPGLHDHSAGLLSVGDGSRCDLNGCSVTGSVATLGTGYVRPITTGAAVVLTDVALAGTAVQPNDTDLMLRGTLDHDGDWSMLGAGNSTDIYIDGPVTLTGGGTMHLSNSPNNRFSFLNGGLAGDYLTIDGYRVHGAGQIGLDGLDVTNIGAIIADQPGGTLVIDPAGTFLNLGLVGAGGGGVLRLEPGLHDHSGGLLSVGDGGRCDLSGCSVTGSIVTSGTGYVNPVSTGSSIVLADVDLAGDLAQSNDVDLVLRGTLTHDGRWDMLAAGHSTDIYFDGPVTLTGGGEMRLSNSPNNRFSFLNGGLDGDRLTIEDYTVRGAGQLGLGALDITNNGAVIADQPTALSIDPAASFVNGGELRATGAGGLRLESGAYSSSGQVVVGPGSRAELISGSFVVTGGQMRVDGEFQSNPNALTLAGGTLGGTGLVDSNVANSGGTVAPGASIGTLAVEGDYTQDTGGVLEAELGAGGASDRLTVTGAATVRGKVRAVAGAGYTPVLGDSFEVLTAGAVVDEGLSAESVGFSGGRRAAVVVEPTRVRVVVVSGCVGDWTGDGAVNTLDFLAYLGDWSAQRTQDCTGGGCGADLNGDGIVNTQDFLAFLTAWSAGC